MPCEVKNDVASVDPGAFLREGLTEPTMEHSGQDVRRACPKVRTADGLSICGSELKHEVSTIEDWGRKAEIMTSVSPNNL